MRTKSSQKRHLKKTGNLLRKIYNLWKSLQLYKSIFLLNVSVLLTNKHIWIHVKYTEFTIIISPVSNNKLPGQNEIKSVSIDLVNNNQLFYSLISHFGLIELKILKIYIKFNHNNNLIWLLKSFLRASIFIVCKHQGSFCLFVDYESQNN